jgi:hypothetical protein
MWDEQHENVTNPQIRSLYIYVWEMNQTNGRKNWCKPPQIYSKGNKKAREAERKKSKGKSQEKSIMRTTLTSHSTHWELK